jgi:hypothetical protein
MESDATFEQIKHARQNKELTATSTIPGGGDKPGVNQYKI